MSPRKALLRVDDLPKIQHHLGSKNVCPLPSPRRRRQRGEGVGEASLESVPGMPQSVPFISVAPLVLPIFHPREEDKLLELLRRRRRRARELSDSLLRSSRRRRPRDRRRDRFLDRSSLPGRTERAGLLFDLAWSGVGARAATTRASASATRSRPRTPRGGSRRSRSARPLSV